MASNLRVDSIVPATGTNVSIGTATGGVSIPGVLTYEDVTNVDSVGVITARSGLRVPAGEISLGTGTPRQKLHINASDSGASNMVFTNTTTGTSAGDGFVVGITGGEDAQLNMQESANLKFSTADTERLRIGSAGQIGIAGANYGTSGQVLTSQGASSAPTWASASNPTLAHAFVFMDSQYFTSTPTKMGFNSSTTNDQSSGVTIDRTNKRFTPTVGGVYQVITSLDFDRGSGGSSIEYKVMQYKNGSQFARKTSFQYSTGITDGLTCLSLMSLNGSGDYVEFYAAHNASGNAIMNVLSTFFIIRVGA